MGRAGEPARPDAGRRRHDGPQRYPPLTGRSQHVQASEYATRQPVHQSAFRGELMRQRIWVGVAVALAVIMTWTSTAALAQDPPPPAPGSVVLADSLKEPGLLRPSTCRTGRGGRDFVGEGARFIVTGRCDASQPSSAVGVRVPGLTVADGEVRLEVKAVSGVDRARFMVFVRDRPSSAEFSDAYYILFDPGITRAAIG